MFENTRHHIDVWKESWKLQKEREQQAVKVEEADFLPAALEILEKPASPIGRVMMLTILLFFAIAMAWSVIGRVDVVATAQGKLVPKGNIKVIQPAELGVVRAIHVENGQAVKAGDVLVELDTTMSGADEESAKLELQVARVDKARAEALLRGVDGGEATFEAPAGLSQTVSVMQDRLIKSQLEEYHASIASYTQQRREREAEARVVKQEIAKLEETIPLLEEQVEARAELVEKGLSPRFTYLEYQERLVGQKRDLDIQRDQLARVGASMEAVDKQIEQLRQEFRKTALADLAEAQDRIVGQGQALTKASKRRELQALTAPVDGKVQQLAIHTVGGVVQAGDALMVVVPSDITLQVEANVLNKDIGFVHEGQEVEVKLEAFPFTKYGVIHGRLDHLARDAVQDEHLGLIYPAKISIEKNSIMVEGKEVNLGPGMALTAEIKTGKRRLIEFILSPLLRYKDESMRER